MEQSKNELRTPAEQKNEIILYQPDDLVRLEVRLEGETVWLTQEQIAYLFGTKRPAITKHLNNIYKSGELDRCSTCSILEHMATELPDRQVRLSDCHQQRSRTKRSIWLFGRPANVMS